MSSPCWLQSLSKKLGNIMICGFRLKLGWKSKHLHEEMYDAHRELSKRLQEQQPLEYSEKSTGVPGGDHRGR